MTALAFDGDNKGHRAEAWMVMHGESAPVSTDR
jgi:hypothetical protein